MINLIPHIIELASNVIRKLSNNIIPIFIAILMCIIWGDHRYKSGYHSAKKEMEVELKKKEGDRQKEYDKISESVSEQTREYLSQQEDMVKVEKVYLDRVVEKPVYINTCIDDEGIDRLNSKR